MFTVLILLGFVALATWLIGAFEGTSGRSTMRRAMRIRASRQGRS